MADVGFHMVRPAGLIGEPVAIGPVAFPIDLHVYTGRGQSNTTQLNLLEFVDNFSMEFYAYCAAICLLTGILLAAIHHLQTVALCKFLELLYNCV